ncbi:MAG: Nicotinamide-nucleotide amidohydrolase PncC [Bacteroidetes bacterium ADurb.BinA174]|nr:MAG: Nicotinamide-nucleotide amidohydrolase PncC [Bacteroidetes bacterium ADurb.BinA174]
MAHNVSEKLKADCSIAVSGIAGPDGGTPEKPVGTTWICTKINKEIVTQKYQFGTSREENINRTTNMAILQMIKMLKR